MNISDEQASIKLLDITTLIQEDFGYETYIATEIEFYFQDGEQSLDDKILAEILTKCQDDEIVIACMSDETGHRQYEFGLVEVNNADFICKCTNDLKNIITDTAAKHQTKAVFAAKPFANQPGSGLHIHIHLENKNRFNIFQKANANNDDESEALLYSIGGLLDIMGQSMVYFAPNEGDYKRYTAENNQDTPADQPLRRYNNAPVKISWGSNNRTVAIRIPTSSNNPEQRHIEHRVACPEANIYAVIAAILSGIHHGLAHKIQPSPKIHGNAFDAQYDRPLLPTSLEEAHKATQNAKILQTYLQ